MTRRVRREDGIGVIEFVLIFPLVFLAVLGVVQVALVVVAHQTVADAARSAAHASRNGQDPATAARKSAGDAVSSVSVHRSGPGETWTVDGTVKSLLPGTHVVISKTAAMP